MSPRTLIVGVLAAVCGVCATAGIMTWNRPAPNKMQKIITAKKGIELGTKIDLQMLEAADWPQDKIPSYAITKSADAIGKYCVAPIYEGQPILSGQIDALPTTLQPESGYIAVAIKTESESSSLGKNLSPGNRVDVIWVMTKDNEALGGPFSKRLLENVRVLAVGQRSATGAEADAKHDLKSVTLEVKSKMDENLVLAQELGSLSLAMRNPNDKGSVEPTLVTNIADLLENANAAKVAQKDSPAENAMGDLKSVVEGVTSRVEQLAQRLDAIGKSQASSEALSAESLKRIPAGMRAITIQTPSESTGVAGLLMPGHRVDVIVTWEDKFYNELTSESLSGEPRSFVLLENVEVLAVDTQLIAHGDNPENKKMSRSVTLIGTLEMSRQISQAQGAGTLTLVLRGSDDSRTLEPKLVRSLDELFVAPLASVQSVSSAVAMKSAGNEIGTVRVNRGGANYDQLFLLQNSTIPSAAK
jgi:pilus assembly protein CpaB